MEVNLQIDVLSLGHGFWLGAETCLTWWALCELRKFFGMRNRGDHGGYRTLVTDEQIEIDRRCISILEVEEASRIRHYERRASKYLG
jgi:hypothetical protein